MRALIFALLVLTPALASAQSRPGVFAATDWIDAGGLRPAPTTKYAGDCTEIGCRAAAWEALVADRGEKPLSAPPGGRAYRVFVDRYDFGLGLQIMRLEVSADGKATITSSYPRGRPRSREIPADALKAFDAALATSRFDAAEVASAPACEGAGDEVVFEAVVGGRYKWVVEPCGGEAGLTKAVEILDSQT